MTRSYLETNSIRTFASDLDRLVSRLNLPVYTSALAIAEILSGMNDKEFILRKRVLERVLDSGIVIDWRMPPEAFAHAFQVSAVGAHQAENLKACLEIVRNAENFTSALQATDTGNLSVWPLRELMLMDQTISRPNKAEISENIRAYRDPRFDSEREKIRAAWFSDPQKRTETESRIIKEVSDDSIVHQLRTVARDVSRFFGRENDTQFVAYLISRYDHSLDHFLIGSAHFQLNALLKGNEIAVNDTYDITHLVYLAGNAKTTIVSDDHIYPIVFANDPFPVQPFITTNDFRSLMQKNHSSQNNHST